ncbi:MAG: hypothetical protein U9R32_04070 [Bacteroidota bacterium]|nr:hypothetical protein [Bacteroidota bacterium]
MTRIILIAATFFFFNTALFSQSINKTDADGKKHGEWIKKNSQGEILFTGEFNHGVPVNKFTYYFSDGIVQAVLHHIGTNGKVNSVAYYHSGAIKSEGSYLKQQRDNLWKFYNETGTIICEEFYTAGVKSGVSKTYYPSKELLEEVYYENGVKSGECKQYFKSGKIKKIVFFKNDVLHGKIIVYRPSGEKMIIGNYDNGSLSGKWKYFDENGEIELVEEYQNGKMIKKISSDWDSEEK